MAMQASGNMQGRNIIDMKELNLLNMREFQDVSSFLASYNPHEIPRKINNNVLLLPTKFSSSSKENLFLLVLPLSPNVKNKCHKPILAGEQEAWISRENSNNYYFLYAELQAYNSGSRSLLKKTIGQAVIENLLPKKLLKIPQVYFSSLYEPSSCFGGDLFNIIQLDHNRLAIFIADVSGYGLLSTTLAALGKKLIEKYISQLNSPAEILKAVNAEILKIFYMEDFISVFLAFLNLDTFQLTYSNAGHPSPLLYRSTNKSLEELDTNGFFLGVFKEGHYCEKQTILSPGSKLLLYTDGIIEARNGQGCLFGKNRLKIAFNKILDRDDTEEAVIKVIHRDLLNYLSHPEIEDDRMMVLIERNN
jgi:serine phosphatase RsbU (regulator of sigma subunit)